MTKINYRKNMDKHNKKREVFLLFCTCSGTPEIFEYWCAIKNKRVITINCTKCGNSTKGYVDIKISARDWNLGRFEE